MFRIIRATTLLLIILCYLITSLNAEPYRVFDEGGAFIWAYSSEDIIGLHSLNGGEQVMYLWSERRPEDGRRLIYCQIVNEDGRNEYQEPLAITNDNLILGGISSTHDSEGNMYIAWTQRRPQAPESAIIFAHKIDPQGRRVWAQSGRPMAEFDLSSGVTSCYPDDHGGCYIKGKWGVLAVDENGNLRDEWAWHDEFPYVGEEDNSRWNWTTLIPDETGGFWYRFYNNDLNNMSYDGELLWEEPRLPEGLPEGTYPRIGLYGGTLNSSNGLQGGTTTISRLDENGQSLGENFMHDIEYPLSSYGFRRSDNVVIVPFFYSVDESGLFAYNPDENELTWGEEGVILTIDGNSRTIEQLFEDEHNNLTSFTAYERDAREYPYWFHDYRIDVFKLNTDGELLWDEPRSVDNFQYKAIAKASHGGFYALGRKEIGRQLHYKNYYLNRYNSQVEPVWNEDIETDISVRASPSKNHVWIDTEGNYRIIFSESRLGVTMQTINRNGNIIGDPSGNRFFESSATTERLSDGNGVTLSDRILYFWAPSERYVDIPHLFIFDLDGELLDSIALMFHNREVQWECVDKKITENERYAVVLMRRYTEDSNYYYIYLIDLNEGEIVWRQRIPELEREEHASYYNSFHIDNQSIYWIQWTLEAGLIVYVYDFNGDLRGDPLLIDHNQHSKVIGSDIHPDGWIRIVKYIRNRDNEDRFISNVWLEHIDSNNGELIDSINVIVMPEENPRGPEWEFVSSNENVWIVPEVDANIVENLYSIHCISPDGELWLGDEGWQPESDDSSTFSNYYAVSDNAGGLWLSWRNRNPEDTYYSLIHLDAQGEVIQGWEPSGEVLINGGSASGYNLIPMGLDGIVSFSYISSSEYSGASVQHFMDDDPDPIRETKTSLPRLFTLEQPYPNPFNSTTRITYQLPTESHLDLALYDITGRQVMTLFSGARQAGAWSTILDGSNLSSGVYFIKLNSGDLQMSQKVVLIK